MKRTPVQKFKSSEKCAGQSEKSAKSARRKSGKNVVLLYARPMSASDKQPIPEIPGVDQLEAPEPGSKILAGAFYRDQIPMLMEMAKAARDRATQGRIFIAPEGDGFTIYRRKK